MLAYACVYSFYNQDTEHMDVVEQQTENLELHTNALQILLGEAWPLLSPEHPTPTGTQDSAPTPAFRLHSCPLPLPNSLLHHCWPLAF